MPVNSTTQIAQPMASPVLTEPQAAQYLRIGQRTLRTLVELGKVPSVRLSPRRIVYLQADLDRYIAAQRR